MEDHICTHHRTIDTVTITGTVGSGGADNGDKYSVIVDGTQVEITLSGENNLNQARNSLVTAINNDGTVNQIVTAAAGSADGQITLTAKTAGTAFTATVSAEENGGTADAAISVTTTTANSEGNFKNDSDVDAAVAQLDAAILTLRATLQTFETNIKIITVRLEFTDNLINALEEGAGKLVNADLNEEAANLLALQTRNDLALAALSATFQNATIFGLLQLG